MCQCIDCKGGGWWRADLRGAPVYAVALVTDEQGAGVDGGARAGRARGHA